MDEVYGIDKENFESYIDSSLSVQISDEAWYAIARDLDGRINNYIDAILEDLVQDYKEGVYGD